MRTKLRFVSLFAIFPFIIFLLIAQFGFAQGAATGDLHVTVKDPKGNVVTNAVVTVKDVAKGLERAGSGDGRSGMMGARRRVHVRSRARPDARQKSSAPPPPALGICASAVDGVVTTVGRWRV